MKLSDKQLAIKPLTVGAAIKSFRALNREQDAQDMERQLQFFEDFSNWTHAELLELELAELPVFAREFAAQLKQMEAASVPPVNATVSESGPVAQDEPYLDGQTS